MTGRKHEPERTKSKEKGDNESEERRAEKESREYEGCYQRN